MAATIPVVIVHAVAVAQVIGRTMTVPIVVAEQVGEARRLRRVRVEVLEARDISE